MIVISNKWFIKFETICSVLKMLLHLKANLDTQNIMPYWIYYHLLTHNFITVLAKWFVQKYDSYHFEITYLWVWLQDSSYRSKPQMSNQFCCLVFRLESNIKLTMNYYNFICVKIEKYLSNNITLDKCFMLIFVLLKNKYL